MALQFERPQVVTGAHAFKRHVDAPAYLLKTMQTVLHEPAPAGSRSDTVLGKEAEVTDPERAPGN